MLNTVVHLADSLGVGCRPVDSSRNGSVDFSYGPTILTADSRFEICRFVLWSLSLCLTDWWESTTIGGMAAFE